MVSEPILIWGIAGLVAATIVLPSFVVFWRRVHQDRQRLEEASRLGIDKPVAQYPFIDPTRCIGCGTCVEACPEGDVLGVVGGTAVVINGLRCVGHARCEEACPVGALEVGLGDLKARDDIPLLDDWHESSVPGLFVIGELGGLALIRNAVDQGRRAVERIAERLADPSGRPLGDLLDVIIVGAGPAGLSAALAAGERRLSYLVLDQEPDLGGTILHYPRRKLVLTRPIELPRHGWMKREEYSKEELLAIFQEALQRFELEVRFQERVTEVTTDNGVFSVRTCSGDLRSRFVILAMGRRGTPRKLGVPGEDLAKVVYQLRDAESYRGRRVLCVGGGDSAVEAAIGLAHQPGTTVVLSYRKERFFRIKKKNQDRLERLITQGEILPLTSSRVVAIDAEQVLLEVEGRPVTLGNDDVFVLIGGEPPFPFLERAGVRFGGQGGEPGAASSFLVHRGSANWIRHRRQFGVPRRPEPPAQELQTGDRIGGKLQKGAER